VSVWEETNFPVLSRGVLTMNVYLAIVVIVLLYSFGVGVITERTVAFFESEYPGIAYRSCKSGVTAVLRALSTLCYMARQNSRGGLLF